MLSEYLKEHPPETLLKTRTLYPSAEDREAWEGMAPSLREEIRKLATEYASKPWPMRSATGFLAFSREGSRQADEQPYFARRRKLCAAVLKACAFPGGSLDEVIDGVWLLCEETSWVISAHNINPIPGAPSPREYPLPEAGRPYIDLFSAQTGMILSLTESLLGRQLDAVTPMIGRRIRQEIRKRILEPFQATDDFWWMGVRRKDLNNWTPWILSNILVCAVEDGMPDAELGQMLRRACEMLDRYLDVLPEDGGCDEGAGYWNMAGGALLDCLLILEKVTGGALAFWQNPKLRNILLFPLRAELGNGWFINFADCDARPFLSGERLETAGEKIGNPALAALGRRMRGTIADQLNDVPHLTRALDLIFHRARKIETEPAAGEKAPKDVYLPDLQLRVLEKGDWLLACKGGHNGESHNHNDVGSFILLLEGKPLVVDAGNMVYTAKTFSAERYTLWNVRAAYHNVPMIGEAEQRNGRAFAAREVRSTPDGLRLHLEGAYGPEAGIRLLERALELDESGLRLTDTGELEEARPVTWVFLLREKPAWQEGAIRSGNLLLRVPEGLRYRCEEIRVTDARMARNWPGSLWRVMLDSPAEKQFRVCFAFEKTAIKGSLRQISL